MPCERFYLNADYETGATVAITGNEHHHLSRVMRMGAGEEVELVNGRGCLARARIEEVEKQITSLEIMSLEKQPLNPFSIQVVVPFMRPSKLEWIVEKGTEIGADGFLFFCADHSEKGTLSENQSERLRNLTISALKQSGRLYLPHIEMAPHLEAVLFRSGVILFGDLSPTAPLISIEAAERRSLLFVSGPERGFSESELLLLNQKGRGVRLGPYTLRAETAPLTALSILCQYQI